MKLLNIILLLGGIFCVSANGDVAVIVARDQSPELAIQLYERLAQTKVVRDPSLESAHGLLYFRTNRSLDRGEAATVVRRYLKKQAGIVILEGENQPVARFDPNLPLEPLGNVVRQRAGDLGIGLLVEVVEETEAKTLRVGGALDEEALRTFRSHVEKDLKGTDYEVSFLGISTVSSEELKRLRARREQPPQKSPERMLYLEQQIIERREARRKAAEEAAASEPHGQQIDDGNAENPPGVERES